LRENEILLRNSGDEYVTVMISQRKSGAI